MNTQTDDDYLVNLAKALISKHHSTKKDVAFGRRLKAAVRESPFYNESQTFFGNILGVKQNTVSTWFCGQSKPEADTGIDLCKMLDVSFDWLYTGRGPMQSLKEPNNAYEELTLRLMRTRPSYLRILVALLEQLETQIND